ncbi:MAG: endolytic transglycosylase MltG [Lachnospiraceae bacterium]|nr:endolytic transglycosylase MltG [Lachnospiraceae bacterium]
MKLKYFLRGLGAGTVFATLIMLVAYMLSGGYKLTDEEIIKKAEKLGMVMEEKEPLPTTSEESNDETEKLPETTETITEDMSSENEITEGASTESEVTTQEEEEPETTSAPDGSYVEATIEVVSGMSSYEIAQLLQEVGIIDDAADFDAYLNQNGYSTQLKINTYTFNSDMTYEDIAEALIKEDAN